MTSKIVVNNIEADAGVSTVTFASEVTAPTFNGNITGTAATFTTGTFSGNVDIAGALTYEDVTNVDSIGIITARSGIHVTGGSVGIGTDSPGRLLHLFDIDAPPLLIDRDQSGERYVVELRQSDTTDGNTSRLVYQSDTTGAGAASDVNFASIEFAADTHNQATRAGSIRFRTSQGGVGNEIERLRITSGGDVGLGTATPTSFGPTFQVAGTDPALLLQDTATAVDYYGVNVASGAVNTWFDDASAFVIHTATALSGSGLVERLRIKSNGYVGIGTDNPGHILDLYNSAGSDCLKLNVNGSAGGSNKQNAIKFSVDGDVKAHMGLAVDAGRLISGSTSNDFCLKGLGQNNILIATNSSEKLRITSAGHIGVNNNNPQGIIDVTSSVTSHGLGVVLRKDFNGPVDNTVSKLALTLWGQDHDDAISGSGTDQFGPMIGFGARNDDVTPNTGDVRAAISYSYNGDLVFHAKAGSPGVADGQYERLRIDGLTGMLIQKGFVTTSAERRTISISAGTYTFGTVSDAFAGILYVTGTHNNGHSTRMYIINKSTNGTGVTLVGDGNDYSPARVDITLSGNNLQGQVYYGNRPHLQMITLRGSYTHTLAES